MALTTLVAFVLATLVIGAANLPLFTSENPGCEKRGALDSPGSIRISSPFFQVHGWAFDPSGIREIIVRSDQRIVSRTRLRTQRADVAIALRKCGNISYPGFEMAVPVGSPRMGAKRFSVVAVNSAGQSFRLGQIDALFDQPIGQVDSKEPIRWNGVNSVSGWALAPNRTVRVTVMAEGKEIASAEAGNQRADVQKAFPYWPGAGQSGFQFQLSMATMPLGRYPLRIRLDAPNMPTQELIGPEVWNDEPRGRVVSAGDRLVNPKSVAVDTWIPHAQKVDALKVETENGDILEIVSATGGLRTNSATDEQRAAPFRSSLSDGVLSRTEVSTDGLPNGLHRLIVHLSTQDGRHSYLPGPLVRMGSRPGADCNGEKRRLYYPGNHRAFHNGFPSMRSWRQMVGAGCLEVGIRGRVEYLRTTHGRNHDYVFDPAFPETRRKTKGREMTGVPLNELLQLALDLKAPLLITLDGGVWADSSFSDPEIDVVDMLEEDETTVQWNQLGFAEKDDALANLPGSLDSPQLARMMSLNRFNQRFRHYKKRNLQAAIKEILSFSARHPEIGIAVNFDPDLYINPWFQMTQWYDYNPDTLRQFREWLFHLGPYADGGQLAKSRFASGMTMDEARRLSGKAFGQIDDVEPPRDEIDYEDPWQQIWSEFRRHLVARHYDDLATWTVEAGFPKAQVFTAQTFIQPDVAVGIDSRSSGWTDQAGVSIEGAKPTNGHIGAILYGPASRNLGKARAGRSLLDNIRSFDPAWGVVEFHPAVIALPETLPTHEESYLTLLAIINGSARFFSPMWGSRADDQKLRPKQFRSYDAMEGTAFEFQLAWWMLELQDAPAGTLLFPFGNAQVASQDGWIGTSKTRITPERGRLRLSGRKIRLESPVWEGLPSAAKIEIKVAGTWPHRALKGYAHLNDGRRYPCASTGIQSPCTIVPPVGARLRQISLEWTEAGETSPDVVLEQVTIATK